MKVLDAFAYYAMMRRATHADALESMLDSLWRLPALQKLPLEVYASIVQRQHVSPVLPSPAEDPSCSAAERGRRVQADRGCSQAWAWDWAPAAGSPTEVSCAVLCCAACWGAETHSEAAHKAIWQHRCLQVC